MFSGSRFGGGALNGSRFDGSNFGGSRFGLGGNTIAQPRWGGGWGGRGWGGGGGFGWGGRGFGCWGCGFGFGLGWGWGGWGWGGWGLGLGWGGWGWGWGWGLGPWWWNDPWLSPWGYDPGYAYPDYDYPPPDYNPPPPYGPGDDSGMNYNPDQPSISASVPQADSQPYSDLNPGSEPNPAPTDSNVEWDNSNSSPDTGNVAHSRPTVLLYLKDGTTFPASDYWLADGKLHFRVSYGGTATIDPNDLDWQRTVNENAKRGVTFTLTPEPVVSPAQAQTNLVTALPAAA
jgi:hypothetical protein